MQAVDADEEHIFVLVNQLNYLTWLAVYLRGEKPVKLPHTVVAVDDVVAGRDGV